MVDFLKANPYVTREEYIWEWSIPQIKLASYDFTHVNYLSEKEVENKKAKRYDNPDDMMRDLGMQIF